MENRFLDNDELEKRERSSKKKKKKKRVVMGLSI